MEKAGIVQITATFALAYRHHTAVAVGKLVHSVQQLEVGMLMCWQWARGQGCTLDY